MSSLTRRKSKHLLQNNKRTLQNILKAMDNVRCKSLTTMCNQGLL